MMTIKTQIPTPIMILIRISFHLKRIHQRQSRQINGRQTYHICLRTRLAPLRNP